MTATKLFAAIGLLAFMGAVPAAEPTAGFSRPAKEWICATAKSGAQTCCGVPADEARPKDITYAMAVEHCRAMNREFVEFRNKVDPHPRPRSWRDEKHDYRGCWVEDGKGLLCPEDLQGKR